ncbi:hypothetical protein N7509_002884, partial [Penicillium cosmopolitanum]
NLGQGTYKDGGGNLWILPAVRSAKEKTKDSNHEYFPILGVPSFRTLAMDLILGESSAAVREERVASCQALSGTGALYIAGTMLKEALGRDTTNHRQVFESIGEGERVGLCAFSSNTPTITAAVTSSLARMILVEISKPPAYGARIIAAILEDEEIYAQWRKDLITMSSRIAMGIIPCFPL